ncbi:MAG: transporter [Fibrobacter sp.]|nr:transporter [Fibrobacter sp.]
MFKKIALAVALVAASSFATWDYYKVPEAGKGQVKGQVKYDTDDPWSGWGINASARYVVIPNLELSLRGLGFASWENDDSDADGAGITDFTFGVRYAIMPIVNVFVDMNLPIGDEDEGSYIGTDEWGFYFGGQFTSDQFLKNLNVGAEVGTYWGFEHGDYNPGLVLTTGVEAGYFIEQIGLTPFVGSEFKYKLTDDEYDPDGTAFDWEDNQGDTQFNFWVGAAYGINDRMSVDAQIKFRSGDIDGDAFHTEANFTFSF